VIFAAQKYKKKLIHATIRTKKGFFCRKKQKKAEKFAQVRKKV